MKLLTSLVTFVCLTVTSLAFASPELSYSVLQKHGNIELRQYGSFLTASVSFNSNEELEEKGFDILADYIFGNNIPMTSPVFTGNQEKTWTMTFAMPSRYTIETLPRPVNKEIVIEEVPPRVMATIRFNGEKTQKRVSYFEKELRGWIIKKDLKIVGSAIYAGHNPPWTLPENKRNEVLFEISQ